MFTTKLPVLKSLQNRVSCPKTEAGSVKLGRICSFWFEYSYIHEIHTRKITCYMISYNKLRNYTKVSGGLLVRGSLVS